MSDDTFWIIGCGNMARAMLSRWLEKGMDPASLRIVDPAMPDIGHGVTCLSGVPADAALARRILIAVKPQSLDDVAPSVARIAGPETQILSILAGVDIDTLRARFPAAASIVRVMPNLPVALGKGVVALHARDARDPDLSALMAPLGLVEWIDDEAQLHLLAAIGASGPAFLYRFVDALASAAARLGLGSDQAARIALAMVEGAAGLAAASDASPETLADRVASKGGMTRAGLDVLDQDEALVELLTRTLDAAERRSVGMGEAARSG